MYSGTVVQPKIPTGKQTKCSPVTNWISSRLLHEAPHLHKSAHHRNCLVSDFASYHLHHPHNMHMSQDHRNHPRRLYQTHLEHTAKHMAWWHEIWMQRTSLMPKTRLPCISHHKTTLCWRRHDSSAEYCKETDTPAPWLSYYSSFNSLRNNLQV